MKQLYASLCLLALAAAATAGEESEEEATSPWSGKAGLGYLSSTGNTETLNFSGNFAVNYAAEHWTHEARLQGQGARDENVATAERYNFNYKASRDINEKSFFFGRLNYEKDRFSGYDQQISETVGYGRRLIATDAHELNFEVGAGLRQQQLNDGTNDDGAIFRVAGDYTWTFSETASLEQKLGVEIGDVNTYTESVTSVKARLVADVALVLSYTVKNNSDVPADTENTDTYTSIAVEYAF